MDVERLNARAAEIADRETKIWLERTPGSAALYQRAVKALPAGVASNFQGGDPYPVYLEAGKGSKVWDVDGTEYIDFHGGFGVIVVGHAHPKIVEAITQAAARGTHFASPTEATVLLAEELCERFRSDQVRFVNSGTEATMDAIRVARAATGRDHIVKIEGSYHGHHDSVMFSVVPTPTSHADKSATSSRRRQHRRAHSGHPEVAVGRHARRAVQRPRRARRGCSRERGDEIAALDPRAGDDEHRHRRARARLPAGLRDLLHRHGALLIFDEVKCGGDHRATAARPSATACSRDLACFAKAICGGTPGRRVRRRGRRHGRRSNAAPRSRARSTATRCRRAAGLAALTEVLTPDAYDHLAKLGTHARRRVRGAHRRQRHPGPHGRPRRQGLRLLPEGAAHELPRLPGDQRRALLRVVPVDGEPRDLHDPRRRGAVDALGAAHRGRHPAVRRRLRRVLHRSSPASPAPARSTLRTGSPAEPVLLVAPGEPPDDPWSGTDGSDAPVRRGHRSPLARDRRVRSEPDREPATARSLRDRRGPDPARRRDRHARGPRRRRSAAHLGEVLAPATISTDHPSSIAFVPGAPTKAARSCSTSWWGPLHDRGGLDRRRGRDLGREPGAAMGRRPGELPRERRRGVRLRGFGGQPVGAGGRSEGRPRSTGPPPFGRMEGRRWPRARTPRSSPPPA